MQYRTLGRTDLKVSVIGFGCGAVGGLIIKGDRTEIIAGVAHAIDAGITYFDTARGYGNGVSETNLGMALEELGADVAIGTKVDLRAEEMADIEGSIIASVEGSLRRLGRDYVDLIQLHNPITSQPTPGKTWVTVDQVKQALDAFDKLVQQDKVGHYGINGIGDTPAVLEAIDTGLAATTQTVYNLLNPSSGLAVPDGFPFQNYGQLIDRAVDQGMGTIAIRVLAGGALTGTLTRQTNAAASVGPIGTGASYAHDVALAQRFAVLVEEGYAETPVEAAIRFAISNPKVSTAMVGLSNLDQLQQAIAYADRGPLPVEAIDHVTGILASLPQE